MILALDLGTACGWCIGEHAGNLQCGVWKLSGRAETMSMRFVRLQRNLDAELERSHFAHVVYEEVKRHSATYAAQVYGGLQATVLRWCEDNDITCEGVPVQTIKKHWTGKGNAGKPVMKMHADMHGYDHKGDENEIDALALAHWYVTRHPIKPAKVGRAAELLA